jgi:hypothetical protein
MALCSGIRADGARCGAQAMHSSSWCFSHDPAYEEQRRRRDSKGGKRGGRGRPLVRVQAINQRLEELSRQVIDKEVDRGDAAVAGQLLNYVLRGISIGLKAREMEELEGRLEELELTLQTQSQEGGRSWYGA